MVVVDHLMMGVSNFEETAQRWRDRYGWAALYGSSFDSMPGWGNWIVPLGDTWIEWIGLLDPTLATDPMAPLFQAAVASGEQLMGWAIEAPDLAGVAARLEVPIDTHRATGPAGVTSWRQAGFTESRTRPYLPFFLEWTDGALRERSQRLSGEVGNPMVNRTGVSMRLSGDQRAYEAWIGEETMPAEFSPGPPSLQALLQAGDQTIAIG